MWGKLSSFIMLGRMRPIGLFLSLWGNKILGNHKPYQNIKNMKMTTKMPVFGGVIAALLLLGGYGTALGQGTLNFFTYNGNGIDGEVLLHNGTAAPSGTYSAELFGSASGSVGTFTAISPVTTFYAAVPGYVDYGILTLPTQSQYTPGNALWYELVVWTASAGSYAAATGIVGDQYGTTTAESLVLGGTAGSTVYTPQQPNMFPNLTLTLTAAPEPATLALMGFGGLSLLLFRRKNS
jgi:hypothetical protein